MGKSVAFLGLGVMGYPMAGHLAGAGHKVTVYNRNPERAAKWLLEHRATGVSEHGLAATPREAAEGADVVFACVGADDDLRDICIGDTGGDTGGDNGAFAGMTAGAIFCDHTTVSAVVTREMAAVAAERGIGYLDAPVSGGEAGAVNGQLTIMVGGAEGDYASVEPVIKAYAKMARLLGPVGAGQTTKMVNQICIAGVVQGLAEALHFALEAGLDAKAVVEVISGGAAQSWQMDNRAGTMIDGKFDFGFAVDWMRKDLAIVLGEAEGMGISLPLTELVDGFYAEVQEMGGARNDTSSLIRRFRG
ncbi:MAG: NAD(P)-dependent oxidoreductase [Proteobacteria bacterium]|nr:NAD(P)-dependent oxidoreductase [Pseudomonadota bacterium]